MDTEFRDLIIDVREAVDDKISYSVVQCCDRVDERLLRWDANSQGLQSAIDDLKFGLDRLTPKQHFWLAQSAKPFASVPEISAMSAADAASEQAGELTAPTTPRRASVHEETTPPTHRRPAREQASGQRCRRRTAADEIRCPLQSREIEEGAGGPPRR